MEYVEDFLTVTVTDSSMGGLPDFPDDSVVRAACRSMRAKVIEGEEWEQVDSTTWRLRMLRPDPWVLA